MEKLEFVSDNMKNKTYHGTVLKLNTKIVERCKLDTPNAHFE
jgi:hypothetical protein